MKQILLWTFPFFLLPVILVSAQAEILTDSTLHRRRNYICIEYAHFKQNYGIYHTALTYERNILDRSNWFIIAKLGHEPLGTSLAFTFNIGRKERERIYLEGGIGQYVGWSPYFGFLKKIGVSNTKTSIVNNYQIHPILGIRYQPNKKGIMACLYLRPTVSKIIVYEGNPVVGIDITYGKWVHSWLAFKLGYNF